jgi:hypothetical protein
MARLLLVASACMVVVAIGCTDPSGVQPPRDGDPSLAVAHAGSLSPLVFVIQSSQLANHSDAPVVPDLGAAMLRVAPGGTIRIFDGTFVTQEVSIDRPVTIEAATGAQPTLDASGALHILNVATPHGEVLLRDLRFVGALDAAVNTETLDPSKSLSYDQLRLDRISVEVGDDGGVHRNIGLNIVPSPTTAAQVVVRQSRFAGGQAGVVAIGAGALLTVLSSSFGPHAFDAVQFEFGAIGRAESNTLAQCGSGGCIRASLSGNVSIVNNSISFTRSLGSDRAVHARPLAGATVVVDGNQITDTRVPNGSPAGVPYGIAGSGDGNLLIRNNSIDGLNGVSVISGASIQILGNTIRGRRADQLEDGITVNTDPALPHRIVVSFNTIVGTDTPSDPADPNAYTFADGGIEIDAVPVSGGTPIRQVAQINGNSIRNALRGITAFAGASIQGTDNVISTAYFGLTSYTGSSNAITRSDILDYRFATDGDGILSIRCNWWGAVTGPHDLTSTGPTTYAPWASGPIAHNLRRSCVG